MTEVWPSPADIMRFDPGDPAENPWVTGRPLAETIHLETHLADWSAVFEEHRQRIAEALGPHARTIEHVGSTAVPGLLCKPVVDIDLIIDDPAREELYVPPLAKLGYVLTVREPSWYGHRMLRHDQPRVNLHVFGPNCPEHYRHLLFRDWLRDRAEDRILYARAKEHAREGCVSMQDYNRNKEGVIRDIYRRIFISRGWLAN